MKRFFLGAVLVFGATCAASAQDKPVSLGVRAGVNINSLSYSGDDQSEVRDHLKSRAGFHVGLVADCKVAGNFYIQPGLFFTTRGAKIEVSDAEGSYAYQVTGKVNMNYLQIPVQFSYRFPLGRTVKLDVNVGPYAAVGLGGKMKVEETERWNGMTETYKDDCPVFGKSTEEETRGDFRRFDAGLRFGAGVNVRKFRIGLVYDLGLVNLAHTGLDSQWDDNTKLRNGSFQISVGYNF